MSKNHEWLIAFGLLFSLGAHAQVTALDNGGSNGAGNGGGEDITFPSVRDEVSEWLHRHLDAGDLQVKLELAMQPEELVSAFDRAVSDVENRIEFVDEQIVISGLPRVCKNEDAPRRIVCDKSAWKEVQATQGFVLYGVVFHEYLGIAGIEPNLNEYSQYPISSKITRYAWRKSGYELKDALNPEIGFDELMEVIQGRKDYVGSRWWWHLAGGLAGVALPVLSGGGYLLTFASMLFVGGDIKTGSQVVGFAHEDGLKKKARHLRKVLKHCMNMVDELNAYHDGYTYFCGKPYIDERMTNRKVYSIEIRRKANP